MTIAEPPGLGDKQPFLLHSAKKPVLLRLNLSKDINPARVAIWDAHQKLAEMANGPWEFVVTLKPGIHSLIATVEDSAGRRFSRPHTIVVGE